MDPIIVSVENVRIFEGNSGFPDLDFLVELSRAAPSEVSIDFRTFEGTATAFDFFDEAGTLTIGAGDSTGTITVEGDGDQTTEPDESFFLELFNASGASFGNNDPRLLAQGVLLDDDTSDQRPSLFVEDVRITEGNSGSRTATFDLALSRTPGSAISLDYELIEGSATAGSDFTDESGTVTFAGGQTEASVTVDILGDQTIETSETFSLAVTPTDQIRNNAQGAVGTATILDDDAGAGTQPVITVSDARHIEGNSGFPDLAFQVRLSTPAPSDVMVDFRTFEGTADANDFFDQSGQLTIAAGDTTGTIIVEADGDQSAESDEAFTLELFNAQGAVLSGGLPVISGRGIIQDEDSTDTRPSLLVGDVQLVEGSSGNREAVFSVALSRPANEAITLSYETVDGTATAGSDFTDESGTLTFAPGQTEASVAVDILGDQTIETSETFSLAVTPTDQIRNNAQGAVGTATILDDDAGAGTQPVITVSDARHIEGNSGFPDLAFQVRLSTPAPSDVMVDFRTFEGTADANDFFDQSGQLTIAAGDTTGTIIVEADGDQSAESDEAFTLELFNAQGAVLSGGLPVISGRGIIQDEDSTDTRPSLLVGDVQLVEGSSGNREAVFSVALSRPANEAITLSYETVDGTATAGSDFTDESGTLTFAPGQTEASVAVDILGDQTIETSETFSLAVTPTDQIRNNAQGAVGTATILDDDAGGGTQPVITVSDARHIEGNSGFPDLAFQVRLSTPAPSDVTVDFRTFEGTADANDFFDEAGQLTIAAGDTTGTIIVEADGDTGVEVDEAFTLELSNAQGAVFAGGVETTTAQGIVQADDTLTPRPSLLVDDVTMAEGNSGSRDAVFSVVLSRPAEEAITVDYTTVGDTAGTAADFTGASGSITFAPGQTEAGVRVPIQGDTQIEGRESFDLIVAADDPSQLAGGRAGARGTGTIIDNDSSGALPVITVQDVAHSEGDSGFPDLDFQVNLSSAAASDVQVDFRTVAGTAQSDDFFAEEGTLTIPSGDTTGTITVEVDGDTDAEGDESFALELSNPQGASLAGGATSLNATGTIKGDDTTPPTAGLPELRVANVEVDEPASGSATATFTLSLTAPAGLTIGGSFDVLGGTATAGTDFQTQSGSFQLSTGQISTEITVPVFSDSLGENDETFVLRLDDLTNAQFGNNADQLFAIGTIRDEDGGPTNGGPTNQPPVAADDSGTVSAGGSVVLDVLANDSDPDGDALTIAGVDDPANGTVTLNDDGTLSYTADAGFSGTDSFTYTIDDGNGGMASASVSVSVTAETPDDGGDTPSADPSRVILGGDQQALAVPFNANIIGTAAGESIQIRSGARVEFGANAGDRVVLPGALGDFDISAQGNALSVTGANGTVATISLNTPVDLVFADGRAMADIGLENSGIEITVGGETVGPGFDPAAVALQTPGSDPNAGSGGNNRVILPGESQSLEVPFNAQVVGTAAAETVQVSPGARVEFGANAGDRVELAQRLDDLDLASQGNALTLSAQDGTEATISLNTPLTLAFADGSATADIGLGDSGIEITVGGQTVGPGFDPSQVTLDPSDPSAIAGGGLPPLSAAEVSQGTAASDNIDGDQDGATLSGGAGTDRFIFDGLNQSRQVTIADFEADEAIRFEGGFQVGDLNIANDDPADGGLELTIGATVITLNNLTPADDGPIFNANSFQDVFGSQALDFA